MVIVYFIPPVSDVSFDEMMGYPYEHEDEMINEIGNITDYGHPMKT